MKFLRVLVRITGWLLTPLVAWAASFIGAWIGAGIGQGFKTTRSVVMITIGFGLASAIVAAWGWLHLLRHSPWLQHALEVTPEGAPLAAVIDEPPEESR